MKLCNICHKISATDQDHLDCVQGRSIETGDENFKNKIPEELNLAQNTQDLGVEIRAVLEHITKNKDTEK